MTQDKKDEAEEQPAEQPKIENLADWSTDFFPTSAKKVYVNLGMIFFGIVILILLSMYLSADEETEIKKEDQPKKQTENIFSQEEDQ